jgi:N-acetylglucosaminyldiphosphoundecaprenol N-acetyl-beta-D-mannosaminyltransferase
MADFIREGTLTSKLASAPTADPRWSETVDPAPNEADVPDHYTVLGVPISVTSLDDASARIHRWAHDDRGRFVFVREVAGLMAAVESPELLELHKHAAMVTADGMPLVWLGKLKGKLVSRTCGADLMTRVLGNSEASGLTHYFYGGKPGVAEVLRAKFLQRFPRLKVVGVGCPPFRPLTGSELSQVAHDINESGADVVWIGISSPKQELLMRDLQPLVRATMLGVGAAFDFHSGAVTRAPVWMQKSGLEWFYRLCSEPQRLWKRYLVIGPQFIYRLALSSMRTKA